MSDSETLDEEEWLKKIVTLDSAVFDLAQDLEESSLELKVNFFANIMDDELLKQSDWLF